jgi:hypothetical protein
LGTQSYSLLLQHDALNIEAHEAGRVGSGAMTKIFIDVVLFSCMFALVTGVVFAAAHVLG